MLFVGDVLWCVFVEVLVVGGEVVCSGLWLYLLLYLVSFELCEEVLV